MFMQKWIWFMLVSLTASAGTMGIKSIDSVVSVERRADGNFDVRCIDNTVEVRTEAEVLANQVCTHIANFSGLITLQSDGASGDSRLCDIQIKTASIAGVVINLTASFAAPCNVAGTFSNTCTENLCTATIGTKVYQFDFTNRANTRVTRQEDGLVATYSSTGAGPTPIPDPNNGAKLRTFDDVDNILMYTRDGVTMGVCDDYFGFEDANVACRELGYNEALEFNTVEVYDHNNFGMDDLQCTGNENSLWDCPRLNWGDHNCSDSEHIQLICQ